MDGAVLEIILRARDEASKTLKNVANEATKTGATIKEGLQNNVVELGSAFVATTGFIYKAVQAYEESQSSLTQLNTVLTSTKGVAGVTRDQVIRLSSALQQQSKYSDEAVTDAQSLLLTFTNIGKNIFPQATKTVLDMSQALGQDLKSSSIQLGKALQDPILGVTALRRVGVNFNEQQQETIKGLVESGHLLDAQTMILRELGTEFGGSALAASKTFAGQMIILKNNLNDVQETIGKGIVESLVSMGGGMEGVNAKVKAFNDFLITHKDVLMGVVLALGVLAVTFTGLFVAALIVAAGTAGLVIAGIGALGAALGFTAGVIIYHWSAIVAFFKDLGGKIAAFVAGIPAIVGGVFELAKNTVTQKMTDMLNGVLAIWNTIKGIFDSITGAANSAFNAATKGVTTGKGGGRAYANGTDFAPGGLALVGERGPELVNLPRGSQVIPNTRTEQIMNTTKSVTMNNYFTTDISADTLIRQLSFAFKFDSAIL